MESNSMDELLKCPVCFDPLFPPINQCSYGHTICSACKLMARNQCPTCLTELGDIRCLALEKVAHTLKLPCKYSKSGCIELYPYYIKLDHEKECRFRPYNCPWLGSDCNAVGDIEFLVQHLKECHKVEVFTGSQFEHEYVLSDAVEIRNESWKLMVFRCFGKYFCLYFGAYKLGATPVYKAFVQVMGDESEAMSYRYSLEVEGRVKKLKFDATSQSIRVVDTDRNDGLMIHGNMENSYLCGSDFKLRISSRIWPEKEHRKTLCKNILALYMVVAGHIFYYHIKAFTRLL